MWHLLLRLPSAHVLLQPATAHTSPLNLQMDIKVALSNSFGFGGHNSCILFKAFGS